ncbi:MAG: hypothetical protein GY845_29855 [Planctomycetes bacterium]|nr:hypothetical protein [Planctomycetota bacterium]
MVRQILIYVTSAVLVLIVQVAKDIILLLLPMVFIKKLISMVTHSVLNILLNITLVYTVVLLCNILRVQPVFYMLTPAIFLNSLRSRKRRRILRSGYSIEESLYKDLVESKGEQPDPDYRLLLLRREYVNEITSLMAFFLGGFLFMRLS